MDNKFNEVRRLVEEDDELKTSDRYTKVRAKNHLFEWSGQQLDILLRRVAGAKKVLTNLLSKKADLVDGKVPKSQLPSDIGGGSAFNDYTKAGGTKTQEEFNPAFVNSVDNSDLFFILPEGTKFPYTLTEDDKSNLAKALFIIATSSSGRTAVYAKTLNVFNGYQGYWINSENAGNSTVLGISDKVVSAPSWVNFGLVTYTPQTLKPQQQEQARKNINSAPGYYNQNGFVISPLGMSAIGFRYIAYKEEQNSTICYILTQSRCLKMDFETFEVFWDVKVEGTTEAWHEAAECLRVIGNVVYVIRASWVTSGGIYLVQLDDSDGSTIQTLEIPIKVDYGYDNFRTVGCPLITENYIYAVDRIDKQIKAFNIDTLETSVVRDNISSFVDGSTFQRLLWITNEENKPELVMINWFDDIIHLMRQDGTTIEIELEGSYNKSGFCIYAISFSSKRAKLSISNSFYNVNNIQGSNGKYSGKITASRSLSYYGIDIYSNSEYISPSNSMKVRNPNEALFYYSPIFNDDVGALFLSNKSTIAMVADVVSISGSNDYTNIKKVMLP